MSNRYRSQGFLVCLLMGCASHGLSQAIPPPMNTQQLLNEAQQKLQPTNSPVWNNDLRVNLSPYGGARGVFIGHYEAFSSALSADDPGAATAALGELQNVTELNDYEKTYVHLASYQLAEKQGKTPAEQLLPLTAMFDQVNKAKDVVVLPPELVTMARRALFKLQMRSNHLREATHTYEQMQQQHDDEAVAAFSDAMSEVQALAENGQHYPVAALLDDRGEWRLALHKRQFFIDEIKGSVTNVDAACDEKNQSLTVEALIGYTVPPGWGECVLTFKGDAGTSFVVTQYRE